jgi:cysteine desulfurase
MKKMIYCDSAASTPLDENVIAEMTAISSSIFGNPSSIHKFGQETKAVIERARLSIANDLGCDLSEIIFTGCGSESNNIALLGILKEGDHLITSSYEHPAVLNIARNLEKTGVNVSYISPDNNGLIDPNHIENKIKANTKLISVMYVNNELGTINPIDEIGAIARKNNILFHTDAVQIVGKEKINLNSQNIDLLSLSAHKFYGPKGVGALYLKNGINLTTTYFGGGQEKNLRPGTENVSGIHGMAIALNKSTKELSSWIETVNKYEDIFINELSNSKIKFIINGKNRLPGIINITFIDIQSADLVMALDMYGYAISGGSACSSGSTKPSATLKEIGMDDEMAMRTVRISFGKNLTTQNIQGLSKSISNIINDQTEKL